jgi:hypothetical protein
MDEEDESVIEDIAARNGVTVEEAQEELDGFQKYAYDKLKEQALKEKPRIYKRDKSKNKPEFNKMVKKRRAKAKHDAKARKTNRKKK